MSSAQADECDEDNVEDTVCGLGQSGLQASTVYSLSRLGF